MKKLYFLFVTLLIASLSFGQKMVITGVFEGPLPGGSPKVIELYVNEIITDLAPYGIGSANDGGGTDGEELGFLGTQSAGNYMYIAYEVTPGDFNTYFGLNANYIDDVANIDGGDAIELFYNGNVIDTFGDINTDGSGQPWAYEGGWAYRTSGTGPEGTTFSVTNWTYSGINATNGCATNGSCSSMFPVGTYTTVATTDPVIETIGTSGDLFYYEGNGPSGEESFFVYGSNLTTDIVLTAPTNFEISLTSGSNFINSINISPSSGTVDLTTIYVQMVSGLAANNYSDDITLSSTGVTDKTVSVSGNVYSASVCANIGDIIITEIMQNPSATDDNGEYFEIYNTSLGSINLKGYTISDAGTDSHTINTDLIIASMEYAILGNNGDSGTNGGITLDYTYSGFILDDISDEIIISCSSTVIDEVHYDGGATFPSPTNASMELSTTAMNSTDNDDGANWGVATSTFGSGDLGTPRAANDFTLSNKTFDIAGFNISPNPTSLGYVNVTAKSTSLMDIAVFDLLGKQVIKQFVSNKLDVSSLKSGVYIMKITQDGAVSTRKLVIK
ncbi:lamin tail domain-containing protein [Aestuariibaculum sp. M13]|uniref:lamin tail domain-containing protein n=1 Tax=Aestuariibaculum sp. M13 TaxID=2967132 RepID=UPI002159FA29|nr:lamin tail domain-containing protein [Aestuariibaculum sp. M13]MCR8666907.1 lamin tail domain-containing protein [Aestuariibaculum sp. M13]